MKLNPTKYAFGVTLGKFFGFMISNQGIEANLKKIRAVQEMTPLRMIKEVQHLTERIITLNRFVSRSVEWCSFFFQTLRYSKNFQWTDECQKDFTNLKNYLSSIPLLGKPDPGEELFLYLSISPTMMGVVLVQGWDRIQKPIYYISWTLRDAETRYLQLEKLAYSLFIAARKLQPYFQAHSTILLTDRPLKGILHWSDTSRWIAKWVIELSEFDIQYHPWLSIKAQILADFVAKCTILDEPKEDRKSVV